jgi:hypothetical protein
MPLGTSGSQMVVALAGLLLAGSAACVPQDAATGAEGERRPGPGAAREDLEGSREQVRERVNGHLGEARERAQARRDQIRDQTRTMTAARHERVEARRRRLAEQGERIDASALVEGSQEALEDGRDAVRAGQEKIGERVNERVEYVPPEGIDEAITCEAEKCTIDHRWAKALSERGSGLGREAVLLPRKGGGIVLVSVPHRGIAEHLGLRSGDVILSINGTPLDSLAAIGALRESSAEEHSFSVEYEREGDLRALSVKSR